MLLLLLLSAAVLVTHLLHTVVDLLNACRQLHCNWWPCSSSAVLLGLSVGTMISVTPSHDLKRALAFGTGERVTVPNAVTCVGLRGSYSSACDITAHLYVLCYS